MSGRQAETSSWNNTADKPLNKRPPTTTTTTSSNTTLSPTTAANGTRDPACKPSLAPASIDVRSRSRWMSAAMKINQEQSHKPMSLAQVVQARVRLSRWEKMKLRVIKRYLGDDYKSRGMPPIFGFFGKVTAKGKKALLNSAVLLVLNLIFITGCAFAFVAIENNKGFRLKMLAKYLMVQGDLFYFLDKDFNLTDADNITHRPGHTRWGKEEWDILRNAHSPRCFKLDNMHTQVNLWNFWSAFDFCATVLTTIGYGSMSPRTEFGKWFTLLYSVLGIPIMAMYLALFSKGICAMLTALISLFSSLVNRINRQYRLSDLVSRVFSLVVLLVALFGFVCMWSGILNKTNPADSFVKCMYFYVITLTTVGLGDISMTEARPFVIIRVLFLFCVGLTLVTSVFNALRSVSAAHTRMLKAQGRRLTSQAKEAVIDGANKLIRQANNGDGQTVPLTKEDDENYTGDNAVYPDMVETTFSHHDDGEGYNSHSYRPYIDNYEK